MFTPDNFYTVLSQHFGGKNGDIMYGPLVHGAKKIVDFKPLLPTTQASQFLQSTLWDRMCQPKMILYDQEPIESGQIVDNLRQGFCDNLSPDLHYIVTQASFAQLIALWIPSTSFPIWCTSEYKGKALEVLEHCYFVPCSYWYHAFIARDWFRDYQRWTSLDVHNKKHSMPFRFLMYAREHTGSRTYRKEVKQALVPLSDTILHDWSGQNYVAADKSASIDVGDAQTSAVHLVLETQFDSDNFYLTEKIFKPMVMNQAFIIWGPPGTLKFLRSRGFQTFEGIWSEAYDNETDTSKRMHLLISLVQDLAATTPDQWQQIWQKCLPIITHNRQWFYSEDFMNNCWQELLRNFQHAKDVRKELAAQYPGGQFFKIIDDEMDFYKLPARRAMIYQYLNNIDRHSRTCLEQIYRWTIA